MIVLSAVIFAAREPSIASATSLALEFQRHPITRLLQPPELNRCAPGKLKAWRSSKEKSWRARAPRLETSHRWVQSLIVTLYLLYTMRPRNGSQDGTVGGALQCY